MDKDSLICQNHSSINNSKIDNMTIDDLWDVYQNVDQFGCSFVEKSPSSHGPVLQCGFDFKALQKFFHKSLMQGDDEE